MLTAFYTFRAYFLTFWGHERFPKEAGEHPHESPPVMAWPLLLLAVGAVFVGAAVGPTGWFGDYLQRTPGLPDGEELHGSWLPMLLGSLAALLGIALAVWLYVVQPDCRDSWP